MKIAYLTMEAHDHRRENSVGSSRIRGRWVMKYTPEIVPFENGREYDAVIYQKAYWQEHMKTFQGIKIFDLCDPDWLVPRPVTEVLHLMDAATVSTEPLYKYLKNIRPDLPVVIIPDRIDPDEYTDHKTFHNKTLKNLVWFGYSNNTVVLEPVANIIHEMGMTLTVISDRPYHAADAYIKYDYGTVNSEIIKHDAVLLPRLDGNYAHSFKSDNKTLASQALGMPVITDFEDLERLSSQENRIKESEELYTKVINQYHVRQSGQQYLELIETLAKGKYGTEHKEPASMEEASTGANSPKDG
jgi:hypothetical protein